MPKLDSTTVFSLQPEQRGSVLFSKQITRPRLELYRPLNSHGNLKTSNSQVHCRSPSRLWATRTKQKRASVGDWDPAAEGGRRCACAVAHRYQVETSTPGPSLLGFSNSYSSSTTIRSAFGWHVRAFSFHLNFSPVPKTLSYLPTLPLSPNLRRPFWGSSLCQVCTIFLPNWTSKVAIWIPCAYGYILECWHWCYYTASLNLLHNVITNAYTRGSIRFYPYI